MRSTSRSAESSSDAATDSSPDEKDSVGQFEAEMTNLTNMENRVLTLVTMAKTNREIACTLGISPATVKRHIENLLRKLRLRNRVEAAVYGAIVKRYTTHDFPLAGRK
jgi:DNA-binding NarL/FixJ family response regulator